jgi:putative transcriptional regulator
MSKIIDAMLETAHDLHEAGVMNEVTMREFDAMALPPVKEYTAEQIKRIRMKNKVSQPVFAAFLNASPSTVKSWEQGEKHPKGSTLRLLEIVERKGLKVLVA